MIVNIKNRKWDELSMLFCGDDYTWNAYCTSNENVTVVDGDKLVAEIKSFNQFRNNRKAWEAHENYSNGWTNWLPTRIMAKEGLLELFDSRFSKTPAGYIPVSRL